MRKLSLAERILLLGYNLSRNKKDVFGKSHKYSTSPLGGSGGVNYFDSDGSLEEWVESVIANRRSESDGATLLDIMEAGNGSENRVR